MTIAEFLHVGLPKMIARDRLDPETVTIAIGVIGLTSDIIHGPRKDTPELVARAADEVFRMFLAEEGIGEVELANDRDRVHASLVDYLARTFAKNRALAALGRELLREAGIEPGEGEQFALRVRAAVFGVAGALRPVTPANKLERLSPALQRALLDPAFASSDVLPSDVLTLQKVFWRHLGKLERSDLRRVTISLCGEWMSLGVRGGAELMRLPRDQFIGALRS